MKPAAPVSIIFTGLRRFAVAKLPGDVRSKNDREQLALGQTTLQHYPMPLAPPDQHIHRPDARPVQPGCAGGKSRPELRDALRIKSGLLDECCVTHRLVNHPSQATP